MNRLVFWLTFTVCFDKISVKAEALTHGSARGRRASLLSPEGARPGRPARRACRKPAQLIQTCENVQESLQTERYFHICETLVQRHARIMNRQLSNHNASPSILTENLQKIIKRKAKRETGV
ncbi:MAG: hypothetical protein IKD53_01115 [Clostridia bacterium]|nr:hypothetical protein [Clostridia bacterium]